MKLNSWNRNYVGKRVIVMFRGEVKDGLLAASASSDPLIASDSGRFLWVTVEVH
jgi:hypothetical protein